MNALDLDVEIYAVQLRKLAAFHQSGTSIAEVKLRVDNTIQHMKDLLGKDKAYQSVKWNELLVALEKYSRNTADPKWMLVIRHAKHRIKSRIQTAVYADRTLIADLARSDFAGPSASKPSLNGPH